VTGSNWQTGIPAKAYSNQVSQQGVQLNACSSRLKKANDKERLNDGFYSLLQQVAASIA
jgi:hypothetical protein